MTLSVMCIIHYYTILIFVYIMYILYAHSLYRYICPDWRSICTRRRLSYDDRGCRHHPGSLWEYKLSPTTHVRVTHYSYRAITITAVITLLFVYYRLTFAAARYTGNIINDSIYEMLIHMKAMPFLEESLKSFGLLNYHPVHEIMSRPVVVINELSRVGAVYEVLKNTTHNGFPVLNKGMLICITR